MKISSYLYSAAVAVVFQVGPALGVGNCGCSSCTPSALDKDADGYKVRDRIDWVIANMGQSETDACGTVCGDEFQGVCGSECDPSHCGGGSGSRCGCSSCTTSVLGRDAGGFPVGSRIDWVMANLGKSEEDACDLVCADEYPDVCGECDCGGGGGGVGGDLKCTGCSWDDGSTCPDWWCNENQSNCNVCTGTWFGGGSGGGGGGMDIREQGSGTVQVVNDSSETNLHVFFQSNNVRERWIKVGGDGVINNPINWGQDGTNAFDPLGAKVLSEAVIPQGGSIALTIPDLNPPQFQIVAIKMVDPSMQEPLPPSKASDWNGPCPKEVIHGQWPILIEGGKDVVADASAVDGINFRMKYELTTSETEVQMMEITENPCRGIAEKYLVRGPNNSLVGCRSPPKVNCDGSKPGETCDCHPGTQNCAFNECSMKEFDIPNDLMKYLNVYDGGNQNGMPVKSFINDESNIKRNSDFDKYCKQMHSDTRQNGGESDFTCYCYDYNDVASSPWLRAPYKIKVVYLDL